MSDTGKTEKTTEQTAAEKLAASLGAGPPEGKLGEGKTAEGSTEGSDSSADGPEGKPEGKDTGQEKPAEGDAAPEKLTKADGSAFTKADLDALNAALKAARKDARDAQGELATHRTKLGDRTAEQIETEANTAAEQKWRDRLVAVSARAALASAGLTLPEGRESEAMARAVRLLDSAALEIDDTGDVKGLAEQVEALRDDFPSLFGVQKATRTTARGVNGADRTTSGDKPKTAAERLAAQLVG